MCELYLDSNVYITTKNCCTALSKGPDILRRTSCVDQSTGFAT